MNITTKQHTRQATWIDLAFTAGLLLLIAFSWVGATCVGQKINDALNAPVVWVHHTQDTPRNTRQTRVWWNQAMCMATLDPRLHTIVLKARALRITWGDAFIEAAFVTQDRPLDPENLQAVLDDIFDGMVGRPRPHRGE